MSSMTAKAVVSGKQEWGTGDTRSAGLTMTADYQDGRNKEWSAATPAFSLNMTVKGELADGISLGDKVDVTLTVTRAGIEYPEHDHPAATTPPPVGEQVVQYPPVEDDSDSL